MSGTSPRAQLGGSQRAAQGDFPGRAAKPPESWQGGEGFWKGPWCPSLGMQLHGMGCVEGSQAFTRPSQLPD